MNIFKWYTSAVLIGAGMTIGVVVLTCAMIKPKKKENPS